MADIYPCPLCVTHSGGVRVKAPSPTANKTGERQRLVLAELRGTDLGKDKREAGPPSRAVGHEGSKIHARARCTEQDAEGTRGDRLQAWPIACKGTAVLSPSRDEQLAGQPEPTAGPKGQEKNSTQRLPLTPLTPTFLKGHQISSCPCLPRRLEYNLSPLLRPQKQP